LTLSTALAGTNPRRIAAADSRLMTCIGLTLVVAAVSIGVQLTLGMLADVSWLITMDERWLAGQVPYRDVMEINPPASLLLYLPAVALAHGLSLRPEFVVSVFSFASIAVSVGSSARILKRAGLLASVGPIAYAFTLIALAVLPGQAFCERDHLAAVYALPFLALSIARCHGGKIDALPAALAGVGIGVMAAIKPPYALVVLAVLPYLWRRIGLRRLIGSIEYYVAAAVGLIYVASVPWAFPAYAHDVMRMGVLIYLPVREGLVSLFGEAGSLFFILIGLLSAYVADKAIGRSWIAIPALAALGAFGAFLTQGKGWMYHAIPAVLFLTIAAGFALDARMPSRRAMALGALTMIAAAIGVLLAHGLAAPIGLAALAAAWLDSRLSSGKASFVPMLAPFALAATIGAACGFCDSERSRVTALEAALTRLGPHLTLAAITEDMGFGHPMARRIGAVWAQRVSHLFITSAARRLIDEHPGDADLAQKLRPYVERDKAMLIEDIEQNKPDALLVGPLNTRMHAALWADPEISAARAHYHFYASNDRPDFPAEVWVRDDFAAAPAH